jgi:putative phosphoesterase
MIGILSDSHDNRDALRAAVEILNRSGCDLVVHAGDIVAPFAAGELAALSCPVKAVFGNCDGERDGLIRTISCFGVIQKEPYPFRFQNREFLLTHTQFSNRRYLAADRYDVLIYGHTHKPDIGKTGRTLVINPGELGGWVTGKSSLAMLDLESMEADIILI